MGTINWKKQTDINAEKIQQDFYSSNKFSIEEESRLALEVNKKFYKLATPTNAQVLTEIKALAQQNNKIIRLLLDKLDNID